MSNARENVNLLASADWDIATLRLANWGSGAVPPQVVLKTNYVAGDGGGVFRYDASDTTTADNGGTVIVDAAGNRWKRQYAGPLNAKWFGARGDNSTNDTTALQNALNAAANGALFVPAGTYLTDPLSGSANCEIYGSSAGGCILKHRGAVVSDASILSFISKNNTIVHDLTFDWNNVAFTATPANVGWLACNNLEIYNCSVINCGKIGIGVNGCSDIRIHDNYIARTTSSSIGVNEGILLTESGGTVTRAWIENNYIINHGTLMDGSHLTVRNNIVLNWKYGAGVGMGDNASNVFNIIEGNYLSNGYNGLDSDSLSCKGIEFFGTSGRIVNNICWNNGGPGIFLGGKNNVVDGNICFNNGLYTPEVSAGISMGYVNATYNASDNIISNNHCWDTTGASGTQDYGIGIDSNNSGNIFVGNRLSGNKTGDVYWNGSPVTGTWYGFNASGSTTNDFGSISNGASATVVVTVPGALLGDYVQASCSLSLAGMSLTGYVSATNAVTLVLTNNTGSPVDLASATFRAMAIRPLF
jgi:parallel beta-helix repeat protein